jgi:hypothetical protein
VYSKIIHYHIHKTGGTSLNRWLDMLVPSCRARPPIRASQFAAKWIVPETASPPRQQGNSPPHPVWRRGLWGDDPRSLEEQMNRYLRWKAEAREAHCYWDVIHGHLPGIVTLDRSNHYKFIVLREPADRFLSFLRDWRRAGKADIDRLPKGVRPVRLAARTLGAGEFLERFIDHPYMDSLRQTNWLRHAALLGLPDSFLLKCNQTPLSLAHEALSRLFDFVGVAEQLDLVAQCLARDLGASPPSSIGRHNAGAGDTERDELSPDHRALLASKWADDFSLYETAVRRFNDAAKSLAESPYDEQAFEDRHLMTRLAQLAPRFRGKERVFSLNDQIIGSGFLGRENRDTDNVFAWTGPGTRSVLYLPVPVAESLELFLDVSGSMTPAVRESLRIRIDGRDSPFRREPAANCMERIIAPFRREPAANCMERIIVPFTTSRPFAKVELLVDRTYTYHEIGHHSTDARRLGIALKAYGYSLVSS